MDGWIKGSVHLSVSDHVPCADVGTTFEETGPKQVDEWAVRKRMSTRESRKEQPTATLSVMPHCTFESNIERGLYHFVDIFQI